PGAALVSPGEIAMSQALARLLEQPEEVISKMISRLEAKNGYPSHDVRATAENIQAIRKKISQLKLDPDDTTAEELYQALLNKFEADARRFDEHFGLSGQNYDQKIQTAIELVSNNATLPQAWALKNTPAKQLLRQHQPKRVMKQLGYRSVDSLIKRENLAELYLAIEFIESPAWNKLHFKLASQLDTTCFESRPLKLRALTSRWGVWQADEPYLASSDYGALGLLPTDKTIEMSLLGLVVLLLDEIGVQPSLSAELSPSAGWWTETDCLVASLADRPVALNLKDIALSHVAKAELSEHDCATAQKHFWRELLSRYENHLPIDEDAMADWRPPVMSLNLPLNQPAFEYAEDL
ncbi:MAG TPA: hypothetical protein VFK97_00245, partial [Candidatus Saccharimonadales bacterium]|nr:hypothetical protein [Candidatus Saccharimonadales bacterium]